MIPMDWLEDLTPEQRADWNDFVEHFRRDAMEKIAGSDAFISIVPKADEVDVKFVTELGFAIMLGKPLIVLVTPGASVSAKLRAIADEVVEMDIDVEEGRRAFAAAIERVLGKTKRGGEDGPPF